MFSPHHKGFSLIELLVVITLVAILSGIFAPNFARFFRKSRLENSVRIVETTLQQAFSSARATPYLYGVKGTKDSNEIISFKCLKKNCTSSTDPVDPQNQPPIKLESSVIINSENFEVRFIPPHGDMQFVGETEDEITIQILSGENDSTNLKLYKKSGLIERQ